MQVPVAESFAGLLAFLKTPDFRQIGNPAIYTAGLTIALVGSLQALLTTEAVDRLDRQRRTTPANRELVAQGFGNIVCGLLGGMPMTGEIVRSTVNIDAGAADEAGGDRPRAPPGRRDALLPADHQHDPALLPGGDPDRHRPAAGQPGGVHARCGGPAATSSSPT